MNNKRLSSVFYKWLLMLVAITLPIQSAGATQTVLAPTYNYRNSLVTNGPYGLAFDASGKLYVANYYGHSFSVFGDLADETTGTSYTIQDSGNPTALAFDGNGNLYVSDISKGCVYIFESATITGSSPLTPDLTINSSGFGSGGGHGPWGLTLDSANNLYVVGNNYGITVPVFESSAISTALANKDTVPNPTLTPDYTLNGTGFLNGIAFDGSGKLYVTDWSQGWVDIFNSTNLTGSSGSDGNIGGFYGPVAVTFDSADRMYVTNAGRGTVDILTAAGVKLNSIGAGSFSNPQFAVVRPADGLLCVADQGNGRIRVFTPGLGQSAIYSSNIPATSATGLAFLPNGNLAVGNSSNAVSVYNGTTIDTSVSAITGLTNPGAVAAYGDYFYVANNTSAGGVSVYNATTGAPVTLSNNQTGSYGTPTALAAYNGQLYVANYSGGHVNAFNALTGEFIATVGDFANPNGLAFDASGNLYVSEFGSGNIYSYANNRGAFGPKTPLITGLISPAGLAIDQQRYLYVAEQGTSNTVQVYDLAASPPSVIGTVGGAGASGKGLFGVPQFIAISPAAGNPIYVTDSGNNVVQVFNNLNPSAPTLQTAKVVLSLSSSDQQPYTQYTYNYTATSSESFVSFQFRNDPSYWYLDDVSVTDSSNNQLLRNGGFETGSLTGWNQVAPSGVNFFGGIDTQAHSGNYCYIDGSTGGAGSLSQNFSTVSGQNYDFSFWLSNGDTLNGTTSALVQIGPYVPPPYANYLSSISTPAPTGLAFLPNGDIAVANGDGNDTISVFDSDGNSVVLANPISSLPEPRGIALYNGNLFVGAFNSNAPTSVPIFNASTGASVTFPNSIYDSSAPDVPTVLAFHNDQLYVTNHAGTTVSVFNAHTGAYVQTIDGFSGPNGLAFDSAGNMYVSNSDAGTISVYTGSGAPSPLISRGLSGPGALAIDSSGHLFVSDQGNNLVKVYNTQDGSFVGSLGASGTQGAGQFSNPQFIALSPDGQYIYVSDWDNGRIQKFQNLNPSAPTLQTFSPYSYASNIPMNSPNGLVFLPNGHLAVGDSQYGTIAAYNGATADGFSITRLGQPRAMATFNNYLYVVNENTNSVSVSVFNATTGDPVTLPHTIRTQNSPTSLAIYDNKIYVTDFYNGTVDIFNVLTGESLGNISGFQYAHGVAFDANGNLYVSDPESSKVYLCSGGTGAPTPLITNLPSPAGMALDQQGYLYVALDGSNTVSVYDTTRSPPAFMGTFGDTGTAGAGSFNCPNFVAIKPDGTQIYVTDGNNSVVQIFDNHYSAINPTGSRPAIQTTYAYPYPYSSNISLNGTNPPKLSGLAFLPNGHLAVADWGNGAISGYNIPGNTTDGLSIADTNNPIAMSVYNNYLYVANGGGSGTSVSVYNATTGAPVTLSDNTIQTDAHGSQWTLAIYNNQLYAGGGRHINIFNALTGAYVSDLGMPNGGLQNVAGLAFDVNGNLYFSNYSSGSIYRYENTSAIPGSAPNLSVPSDPLISGINNVFGLALDQQGYLYVAASNIVSVYDTTQSPPMLVGTLGGTGTPGEGTLNSPIFIAISPDGTKIYVTDYNDNYVQSFDNPYSAINPAGCRPAIQTIAPYLATYSPASSISVNSPTGLAFLPNGDLVVADGSALSAFRGTTSASFTYEISDSHSPTAVAVYNNYIYAANNISGGGVSVFDAGTGESLSLSNNQTDSYGTPEALAAYNGQLYVADYAGGNVNVFDAETGAHVSQIGGFSQPSGLAFDTAGKLYVSNASGSISVWNGTGSPTALISSGLDSPAGIAIDQQGYLYVVDKGTVNTLKVYKTNGDAVGILMGNTLDSPQFIAISPAENNPIYVTDSTSHKVQVFANPSPMAPALQTEYVPAGTLYGATYSSNIHTNSPTGLAFLSNGKLVAANAQPNNTVSVFNSNGSSSSFANPITSPTDPRAVAVYNNYIYVANYDAGTAAPVSVFDATTGAAVNLGTGNALQTSTSYGAPTALAAYNDKLYVADHTNGNVNYFDINVGRYLGSIPGFSEPNGLAFDKNGNLYVSNSDSGTVSLYSKNGILNPTYIPNLSNPAGLAIDQNGRLYVVNKGEDTVLVYDTTTGPTFVGSFGSAGIEDGEFNSPQFIAISPDGTQLYVTDEGNDRVQVFTHPDGYRSPSALQMASPPKPIVISPAQVAMTQSLIRSSGLSSGSAAVVSAALNSGRMGAILNSMPASVGMNVATSTVTAAAVNTQVTTSTSTPASIVSTVTTTLSDAGGGAGEIQHYHGFTSSQSQKFERLNQELPFLKFQSIESMIDPINAPVSNSSPILMATPFEQPKLALKPLYMANDKNHIWVQPYGGLQKLESYDQVAGLSIKSAGGVMGAGRRVLPNIILGVLAGGAVNSYAQDEKKGDGNISNMYAGVYAAYSKPEGGFRVNGSVIGSQSHYKGNRNINSLNLVAGNSHKGWDASGHIQAGYKIRYGRSSSVDPFVSVGFAHSYQEAYSETNANPFNLNVSSSTTQMGSIEIGSKFERSFMVNEAIVKPLLIVSALREHPIKKPTSATLSFTESGGSFTVPVSTQIKTYATATAGCVVMLKNNVSVSALVSGKIKKHEQAVSAVLKVSYNF